MERTSNMATSVVTFSIVVHVIVDVAVCVATVAGIHVGVAVANAVAITDAVPSVHEGAFFGPVFSDVVGVGTVGTTSGRSHQMKDFIGIVRTSGGNLFLLQLHAGRRLSRVLCQ